MPLLLVVSLLWALSPGLLKHELAGVPSSAIAVFRLALTAAIFLPFLRVRRDRGLGPVVVVKLVVMGAVQFGLMYLLYLRAFAFLQAFEVFVFTALTPILVVALDGLVHRRVSVRHVVAAACAIAGAVVIIPRGAGAGAGDAVDVWRGFLLVQGANLCFAAGQVAYRRLRPHITSSEAGVFGWQALGGLTATLLVAVPLTSWSTLPALLTTRHVAVIAFLGLVGSGAGFFLWNIGQTRVNAGTLGVFNNAKIPLGVLVSLVVFHEPANLVHLAASMALLGTGLGLASSPSPSPPPSAGRH